MNGENENFYEVQTNRIVLESERIIDIPLASDTTKVEIYGTHVAPEFGTSVIYFTIAAILSSIIASSKVFLKRRLGP